MEAANQNSPAIPSIIEWLDSFAAKVVASAVRRPQSGEPVWERLGNMEAQARDPARETTFDTVFCYLAASYGLHAAAEQVRAAGDEAWAAELHHIGQQFMQYATGDIGAIVALNKAQLVAEGGTVH